MSLIDSGSVNSTLPQSTYNHLRMLITRELCGGTDDRPVDIASIMKDCPASASSPDKVNYSQTWWLSLRSLSRFVE